MKNSDVEPFWLKTKLAPPPPSTRRRRYVSFLCTSKACMHTLSALLYIDAFTQ